MPLPAGVGVDLNEPWTRSIYAQLLIFKADNARKEWIANDLSPFQQRNLQAVAHELDLEYEYYLNIAMARISRPASWTKELYSPSNDAHPPVDLTTIPMDFSMGIIDEPLLFDLEQPFREPSDVTFAPPENISMDSVPDQLANTQILPTTVSLSGVSPKSIDLGNDTMPHVPNKSSQPQCWDHGCNGREFSTFSNLFRHKREMPVRSSYLERHNKRRRFSFSSQVSVGEISPATTPFYDEQRSLSTSALPQESHSQPYPSGSASPWASELPNSPQQALSRANSAASIQSNRGRRSARPSSIQSRASSGHGEFVFEVNPKRSSSRASPASGRRGPLDTISKAAMNAVKKVGACWRCKILRKTCKPETPCPACPKRSQDSQWHSVGCRRGQLETEMLPVILCPHANAGRLTQPSLVSPDIDLRRSNDGVERVEDIGRNSDPTITVAGNHAASNNKKAPKFDQSPPTMVTDTETLQQSLPTSLEPLHECIIAIQQESSRNPSFEEIMRHTPSSFQRSSHGPHGVDESMQLLHTAADYQAAHKLDQLVALSLICLRDSLEVLRNLRTDSLFSDKHQDCPDQGGCKIKGISKLQTHLDEYLRDLSRVFFKKDNLRGTEWWLSALYSLCIQSSVRKALLMISTLNDVPDSTNLSLLVSPPQPVKQYLYLAIRLFIARSGSYDPLATDWFRESNDTDSLAVLHFKTAQMQLKTSSWESEGISSSAEFLQALFEDKGEALQGPDTIVQSQRTYSPSTSSVSLPPLRQLSSTPPSPPTKPTYLLFGLFASTASTAPTIMQPQYAEVVPKLSAWTNKEDEEMIKLRSEGMKWDEISKHLPGRSPISCRLRYQNYLEKRPTWDEERKNKLARLYMKFKDEMWQKIATEMGMSGRSAESMAWQLGQLDINARANAPVGPGGSLPPPTPLTPDEMPRFPYWQNNTAIQTQQSSWLRPSGTIDAVSSSFIATSRSNDAIVKPHPVPPPFSKSSEDKEPSQQRIQSRATHPCNPCRSRKQKCDEKRPCQLCKENCLDRPYGNFVSQNVYPPMPSMPSMFGSRRRQGRASQACKKCRSHKHKCNEERPCGFCKENGFECQYGDLPPIPSRPLSKQACACCRERKMDCLDGRACQSCRENGYECRFKGAPT